MKIVQDKSRAPRKVPVCTLAHGSCVVNGEGNLCMVIRPTNEDFEAKRVRLVNLEHGGHYTVKETCEHEPVQAVVTWSY